MNPTHRRAAMLTGLTAASCILVFWAFAWHRLSGFRLNVGTIGPPASGYLAFIAIFGLLGTPVVLLVALNAGRLVTHERIEKWRTAWANYPDRRTLFLGFLFGALIPLAIQSSILQNMPLTDDEGSYRFAAELLASLRLSVPSPPFKLFYDNAFLINDGQLYSQYFLGWPALLSAGILVGVPWLINPLLSGGAAVAIVLIARDWWGSTWARLALLLTLTSPFLMMLAGTGLSHTSTLFALSWLLYFAQSGRAGMTSAWVAVTFCLAFWCRPATAIGIGLPFLVMWIARARSKATQRLPTGILVFSIISGAFALLFLLANNQINGSPFTTGYHAAARYLSENGFRYSPFSPQTQTQGFLFFLHGAGIAPLVSLLEGSLRLSFDAFGWPIGIALILAARGREARWLFAAIGMFLLLHLPLADAGIDTFGPVHFSELMLPLVLLTTSGLRTLWVLSRNFAPGLVPAGVGALLLTSALMYVPVRWNTVRLLAADIRAPRAFVEQNAPQRAVIFAIPPVAPPCRGRPGRHFVFFRPNPSPDLDDDRLWVNHVSLWRDRQFMALHPEREGLLLRPASRPCEYELVPLSEAQATDFPPYVREMPGDFENAPSL